MLFYFCQRLGKEILVEDWKVTINRGLGSVSQFGGTTCAVCKGALRAGVRGRAHGEAHFGRGKEEVWG